jgi:hypothetical protein
MVCLVVVVVVVVVFKSDLCVVANATATALL